ncbi:MAG: UvrD-helicase domain-containing protein [Candidatus Latescibacterota bacterium]
MESLLARFDLDGAQREAAMRLDTHLAVNAGAGSGKTRALVARYLHFVAQGVPLRSLVAVTFTEKAAREMRTRVRGEVEGWLEGSGETGEAGARARAALAELDSARIGTIHALCADLLRLHPAEAGVDPLFAVLEEGVAATLQAQAVEAALAWAATDAMAARLFGPFKEHNLRRLVQGLLANRLTAAPLLRRTDPLPRWEAALSRWLAEAMAAPALVEAMHALARHAARHQDDGLEVARRALLAHWAAVQSACAARDWGAALASLARWRGALPRRHAGLKANWEGPALEGVRAAVRALRACADGALAEVADCDWELDRQAAALLPALRRLGERVLAEYHALKDQRGALDFDDLEDHAVRLLQAGDPPALGPDVRALLVDEFQDTNDRQRQILYGLARFPSPAATGPNLFVVGDEKQSIYRFRGADVTVFRRLRGDIARAGGTALGLDLTFRAHRPLLETVERLLRPLFGEADDPARPHRVPFASLTAYRQTPDRHARPPFVEFHLGFGDAVAGRRAAATALAARLRELHEQDGFAWEHVALLFRASTAFPVYEDALEAAGIPFVTVAGQGFCGRPEIRDLLNGLAAIADPGDDLALAGLLRSPAFGLTDADLFRLRFPDGVSPQPLHRSLISHLHAADSPHALRSAAQTFAALHALAGRLPVAELLKAYLDRTHYRALLKADPRTSRLSRNVDKLLSDAHRSGLVYVGDFLEYVAALWDVGAREGEAPTEASGAVQLMTIHKAKGLEFPLVVVADAGHERPGQGSAVQLDAELGVLLPLGAGDAQPVAWRLGALCEADRGAAEELRLIYVACTRARERLLVSGYARPSTAQQEPGRLLLTGWLRMLGAVIGLDQVRAPASGLAAPVGVTLDAAWDTAVRVTLNPPRDAAPPYGTLAVPAAGAPPSRERAVLLALLTAQAPPALAGPPARLGPRVARGRAGPGRAVDQVVRAALGHWLFPDEPGFAARLRPAALQAGLGDEAAARAALEEARRLLERFGAHPLCTEMDQAAARHHELPYVAAAGEEGVIDVLYRGPATPGWTVVHFATDELGDAAQVASALPGYAAQVQRHVQAAAAALGEVPRGLLVLLGAQPAVQVVPVALGLADRT